MFLDLESQTGLPVRIDMESCDFLICDGLNYPTFRTMTVHELDPVRVNGAHGDGRVTIRCDSHSKPCLEARSIARP